MDLPASSDSLAHLQASYDRLWFGSIGRIRTGAIEIDPVLARAEADPRRGLTLLIRPPEPVRRKVAAFLDELRVLEPGQYYYHPAEFHITFLSLFTATVNPGLFERTGEYVAAVRAVVADLAPFPLHFHGVTASPEAVLLQGYADPTALNTGRDRLRRELQARGLGEALDARYRLETAHMTVMRFRAPLRDPLAFAEKLENARSRDFGAFEIDTLELVKNDWYQTRAATEHMLTCQLRPPPL